MSDEETKTPGPNTPLAGAPSTDAEAPAPSPGAPAATSSDAVTSEAPSADAQPRKPYPGILQALLLLVVLLVLQIGIGLGFFFGAKYLGPDVALNEGVVLGADILLSFAVILAWAVRRSRLGVRRALPFPAVRGAIYPAHRRTTGLPWPPS